MKKNGNTVSYTAEELREMIARGEDQTDWARVDAMTEEELEALIANDPDWADIPCDWHKHAKPHYPERMKKQVGLRLDPDLPAWFERRGQAGRRRSTPRCARSSTRTSARRRSDPAGRPLRTATHLFPAERGLRGASRIHVLSLRRSGARSRRGQDDRRAVRRAEGGCGGHRGRRSRIATSRISRWGSPMFAATCAC